MKGQSFCLVCCSAIFFTACSSHNLEVRSVGYQSVRTEFAQPTAIPEEAKLQVLYSISNEGKITPVVFNLTEDILTIDQTKSFFINTNGRSLSYYDPTVVVNSSTDFSSNTEGASFNWGAAVSALGIGGPLGSILGGITTSEASTVGLSNTSATYLVDQPMVSIGPHGSGAMSKSFQIEGVGIGSISSPGINAFSMTPATSNRKFSVCISYSFDGGNSFDRLVTYFYVSSMMTVSVDKGSINNGFKEIYAKKSDALAEPFYIFHVASNVPGHNTYSTGLLIDYK